MYNFKINQFNMNDREWYENVNPGFVCTGETLEERYTGNDEYDSSMTEYVVMKATKRNYTSYGMCRDCGDHFIIARYSRYDRIDKKTLKITFDTEDR